MISTTNGDSDRGMQAPPNKLASTSDRMMNDSTMPPPRYSSKPRKPAVNPRHRYGLHDWKKLLSVSKDLAQRKGQPIRRDISLEEVKAHKQLHDGWVILRGRVYNLGPYIAYHPGGTSILKGVLGKDATALFDRYHRWVNIEGLIGPLLLGFVAVTPQASPFSVVPPKETTLGNAPRVSAQIASGASLLADEEPDDDEEESILPPPK